MDWRSFYCAKSAGWCSACHAEPPTAACCLAAWRWSRVVCVPPHVPPVVLVPLVENTLKPFLFFTSSVLAKGGIEISMCSAHSHIWCNVTSGLSPRTANFFKQVGPPAP